VAALRVAQIGLGTLAVGLLFATTQAWFGRRAAWIAATLAVSTGVFTFYEIVVLQSALDPVLTALDLYTLTRAVQSGRGRWFVASGAAVGLHALNRPNLLAWGVALIACVLIQRGPAGRSRLHAAAALTLGLGLALAPVAARNGAVTGSLSVLPSHGGLNFFIGNHERADGTYRSVPGITPNIEGQAEDARRVAEAATGRPLTDAEVSAYFVSRGIEWITAHPGQAARLFARKLLLVFNRAGLALNYSYTYYSRDVISLLSALVVGPGLLLPLGLVGLFLGPRPLPGAFVQTPSARKAYWVWAMFVPVYALSMAAFFVATRYRMLLLIPMCAGAGALVDRALEAWRARRVPAPMLAAVAALALVANWPLGLDDGRADERTLMVLHLIAEGRYGDAGVLADRTAPTHPLPGVMRFRLGGGYRAAGRLDLAIAEYEASLAIDAGQPETELALGQVLLAGRRPADAVPHLRAAFEAGYRVDLAGFDLARALGTSGRRDEAATVLGAMSTALDVDAPSFVGLGDLALDLEALDLAVGFYRQAAGKAPADASVREKLGVTLSLEGRLEGAVRELEEACRLDTRSASARLNLAVALSRAGRPDEARMKAEEALRLDPAYTRAREFLEALKR